VDLENLRCPGRALRTGLNLPLERPGQPLASGSRRLVPLTWTNVRGRLPDAGNRHPGISQFKEFRSDNILLPVYRTSFLLHP